MQGQLSIQTIKQISGINWNGKNSFKKEVNKKKKSQSGDIQEWINTIDNALWKIDEKYSINYGIF